MRKLPPNIYERAFENWLIDHRIRYIAIDEHKRAAFGRAKFKSFDFLLYPPAGGVIIAEVKGRKFRGTSLAGLTGFECWVTAEDIDGLSCWQQVFGRGHQAVFVFAYRIENIDVDCDGRDIFDFARDRFIFFCIRLEDYRTGMKTRSPRWKTVTLPAGEFRACAVPISDFLL